MSTLSTTIPATPMPNRKDQPAPMVENRDLQWASDQVRDMMGVISRSAHPKDPLAGRHNYDLLRTVEHHGEQIRDALQRLAFLHPAPATHADEPLRAEVERLTKEADGQFVDAAIRVMRANPGFDARDYADDGISADDFEAFFTEDMNEAWRCVEEAQSRAKRFEAGLKAIASHENTSLTNGSAATRFCLDWMVKTARDHLSQPAPVVEDGTAREGIMAHMPSRESLRRKIEAEPDGMSCEAGAPEGQNAEASLRDDTPLICTTVSAAEDAALATTPAVPDGRTEEVETLRAALTDLTVAFLSRHGCFPLDKTNDDERLWNRAMSRAYLLVGQPDPDARRAALSERRA